MVLLETVREPKKMVWNDACYALSGKACQERHLRIREQNKLDLLRPI